MALGDAPLTWSDSERVAWKAAVPGRGHSDTCGVGRPHLSHHCGAGLSGRRCRAASRAETDGDGLRPQDRQGAVGEDGADANLMKLFDKEVRADKHALDRKDQTNIRFYAAMYAACVVTGKDSPAVADISVINAGVVTEQVLSEAVQRVRAAYTSLGASDQVAKGTDLLQLKVELAERFPPPTAERTARSLEDGRHNRDISQIRWHLGRGGRLRRHRWLAICLARVCTSLGQFFLDAPRQFVLPLRSYEGVLAGHFEVGVARDLRRLDGAAADFLPPRDVRAAEGVRTQAGEVAAFILGGLM